jgi:hypothetical protein
MEPSIRRTIIHHLSPMIFILDIRVGIARQNLSKYLANRRENKMSKSAFGKALNG